MLPTLVIRRACRWPFQPSENSPKLLVARPHPLLLYCDYNDSSQRAVPRFDSVVADAADDGGVDDDAVARSCPQHTGS